MVKRTREKKTGDRHRPAVRHRGLRREKKKQEDRYSAEQQ